MNAADETVLRGVRVLIVEDDADTRDLYELALAEAGAEVRSAWDAKEAIRALLKWSSDILVSDLAMPGMSGLELLREVRSMRRLEALPAVAVSARVSSDDRARALAAGFTEHASKPLLGVALIAIVQRCARRSA